MSDHTNDLASLQPENLQAAIDGAVMTAQARAAARQEAQEEHDRFLLEQAAAHIADLDKAINLETQELARDAQGILTDLRTLTQQAQTGLLSSEEIRKRLDPLREELAHFDRRIDRRLRQIDTLERWEADPIENISRILPPSMRRPS